MKLIEDLHTHTKYSDGKGTPRANVLSAISKGLEGIGISEHAPMNMYVGVRGARLERLKAEVKQLKKEFAGKINVKLGLECNVTAFGQSDIPPDRSEYDYIILGYHKGIPPKNKFAAHIISESFGGKSTPRANAESIMLAAERGKADIISHPNEYLRVDIAYMAQCAMQLGILLEINAAHISMSKQELEIAKSCGAKFIIGSDAHSPERVGDVESALIAAEQACVLDCVVNIAV